MTETPERKVLKETISKLKTKNITSLNIYKITIDQFNESLLSLIKNLNEMSSRLNKEDQNRVSSIVMLLSMIGQDSQRLVRNSISVLDDMQLYIDVLESYSAELDNTLTAIFEKAKKCAEEKTKEQQELMKKDSSGYYVK